MHHTRTTESNIHPFVIAYGRKLIYFNANTAYSLLLGLGVAFSKFDGKMTIFGLIGSLIFFCIMAFDLVGIGKQGRDSKKNVRQKLTELALVYIASTGFSFGYAYLIKYFERGYSATPLAVWYLMAVSVLLTISSAVLFGMSAVWALLYCKKISLFKNFYWHSIHAKIGAKTPI